MILHALCSVYPKWEDGFRRTNTGMEGKGTVRNFQTRERVRRFFENSLLRAMLEAWIHALFDAPLRSYALFFIGFSVSSLFARWFLLSVPPNVNRVLFALFTVIVVLPARASKRSLWQSLEESRFLGRWQREVARARLAWNQKQNAAKSSHTVGVLLVSAVVGLLTVFWTAWGVLLMLASSALLLTVWLTPELGILLLVGAFPFVHVMPHPTAILIMLALWVELAYFVKVLQGRRTLIFGMVDALVLLLGVCYLCAALVGAGGRVGLFAGVGRFLTVAFWFPVRNLMQQRRWREQTFFAVVLAAWFCATVGIYQYFFGDLELKWVDTARFSDIGGRVVATFSNPNILAVYLVTVLPVCLAVCISRGHRRHRRMLGFLSLCTTLLCILLTWTRGAWLAALFSAILFLVCYHHRTASSTILLALPAITLSPLLPSSIVNRFVSIGRLSDSSVCYRLYTWRGSLRLIWHHPWGIGTGEAAFGALYPRFAVSGTESVPHTHHLLLQITAELGVAGGLVLCALIVCLALAFCYALSKLRSEARRAMLAAACGVFGCLILGLFDYIWYDPAMTLLFFFSAGSLIALTERYAMEDGRR